MSDIDGAIHEIHALDRTGDPEDWVGTDRFVTLWPPVYAAASGQASVGLWPSPT